MLVNSRYDPDNVVPLHSIIIRRIRDLFHPFEVLFGTNHLLNHIDLNASLRCFSEVGVACRAKVMKTWLNGWITTHRMSEPVLRSCLLGCENQPDKVAHYVMCPRIFAATVYNIPATSANPLERIGIQHTTKESLMTCACIFSGYHGLKAHIRTLGPDVDMDYPANWCLFAQHVNAEAVECGLCNSPFSPSHFNRFLTPSADSSADASLNQS